MKMYYRKNEIIVEVYHFFEDKTALIFSPEFAARRGNGWEKVKLGQLIPLEYFDEYDKRFMSKTERNKIKERLTLTEALWTCSDGISFKDFDKAIFHERELKNQEEKKEENNGNV